MQSNLSGAYEKNDNKVVNTINHPRIYPAFQMLTNNKDGVQKFEIICAMKMLVQLILCVTALVVVHQYIDLKRYNYANFYVLSLFCCIYLLCQKLSMINNKKKIVVRHIFNSIESAGEKGTLIYFLTCLRKSSFITHKDIFTQALDYQDYKVIFNEFKRIFEIIEKENVIYKPETPMRDLLPLQ